MSSPPAALCTAAPGKPPAHPHPEGDVESEPGLGGTRTRLPRGDPTPPSPGGGDAETQRTPGSSFVGILESGHPAPAKVGAHGRQDPCGSNTHAQEGDAGNPDDTV